MVRDPATFGRALAYFRRARLLTQADLADATNINRQYLSTLEGGASTQQLDRLFRLVRELGLEIEIRARR